MRRHTTVIDCIFNVMSFLCLISGCHDPTPSASSSFFPTPVAGRTSAHTHRAGERRLGLLADGEHTRYTPTRDAAWGYSSLPYTIFALRCDGQQIIRHLRINIYWRARQDKACGKRHTITLPTNRMS